MSKEKAIAKLIPIFRQYGYEGTTLSMLSKASGLGKASLYHHFPQGKEEMIAEVFNYMGNHFSQLVLQPLKEPGKPQDKIAAMGEGLQKFYDNGQKACFLAILSFGEADNLFHEQTKHRLQLWINSLAQVLIEAGIEPESAKMRSQNAVMEIQGALILVRILEDTDPFVRLINNLSPKLLASL